jgi:hypothetical protein
MTACQPDEHQWLELVWHLCIGATTHAVSTSHAIVISSCTWHRRGERLRFATDLDELNGQDMGHGNGFVV